MISNDFYVVHVAIDPFKANPPLVINSNALLPGAVAAELLQAVRRRDAQIVECGSIVKHAQLTVSDLLDILWQPARSLASEDAGGFPALEGFDHLSGRII
jgi:hypothetical protein